MIELTQENVLDALEKAVEEKGEDFIYVNNEGHSSRNKFGEAAAIMCHYVHYDDGTPIAGCIAGNVLNRLGVSLDILSEKETQPIRIVLSELMDEEVVTLAFDSKVSLLLSTAQCAQDGGQTWGDALKEAKNAVSE
jgi:hypothetical protein